MRKSETQIRHDFQLAVCRKDGDPCQYWNKGCTFEKACRKLVSFRSRIRRQEKEEEIERCKKQKIANESEKTFTLAQMLQVLVRFDQSLNPQLYESTKNLKPINFVYEAINMAEDLKIGNEFEKERIKHASQKEDEWTKFLKKTNTINNQ